MKDVVVPALETGLQDQREDEFNSVRDYLVRNYPAPDLAGALINAMSGSLYQRLLELSRGTVEAGRRKYSIWMEGWRTNRDKANATFLCSVKAESFKEACVKAYELGNFGELGSSFDEKRLTLWGCKLFDNEADARRAFG